MFFLDSKRYYYFNFYYKTEVNETHTFTITDLKKEYSFSKETFIKDHKLPVKIYTRVFDRTRQLYETSS